MSNSLNGVFLSALAQQSLPALQSLFAPLAGITTDFSTDIASAGSSVTTRFAVRPTITDVAADGYASVAASTTAKTINLDKHNAVVLEFSDLEILQSSINFQQLFLEPMLQVLGAHVFGDLWNLVTEANFANYYTSTAANFDRSDLIDIGGTLTDTLKAPKQGRALIANPAFYGALLKTLNSAEIPGITADKAEGVVPRVTAFDIYETDLADANSEYLGAFAAHRSALIMAARRVNPEAALMDSIEIAEVVVPGLGLPVTFRRWYDRNAGKTKIACTLIYGLAKGTGMGVRVVTQHA
jgi:hypothetical protein